MWKIITNVEMGKNSEKVVTNIETGQNTENVVTNVEMGQHLKKWSRRSRWLHKTQTEDRVPDIEEFVQNEFDGSKIAARILKEFVTNLLMDQKLEQENMK